MKIRVEWLDGVVRVYDRVDDLKATPEGGLITLYRRPYIGGSMEHLLSIPLPAVREYRREDG
mgnify:CR=1 FL=1